MCRSVYLSCSSCSSLSRLASQREIWLARDKNDVHDDASTRDAMASVRSGSLEASIQHALQSLLTSCPHSRVGAGDTSGWPRRRRKNRGSFGRVMGWRRSLSTIDLYTLVESLSRLVFLTSLLLTAQALLGESRCSLSDIGDIPSHPLQRRIRHSRGLSKRRHHTAARF